MAELNRIPRLKALIDRARRHLAWPELARAFGPLGVFAAVFLLAALLGVFQRSAPLIGALAALIFFAGSAILLMRGLRRYRRPAREAAIRALDQGSELRPLSGLADRPVTAGPDEADLWRRHAGRLMDAAQRLRLPSTRAAWKAADPLRLRYLLPALIAGAAVLAGPAALSRLQSALSPDYGALVGAQKTRIEGWVTPPAYTGRAPIFLKADTPDVTVPAGSALTLRTVSPAATAVRLRYGKDRAQTLRPPLQPDGARQADITLTRDTSVEIDAFGRRGGWRFTVTPDVPPTARFVTDPAVTPQDKTKFDWIVSDDFGVEALYLEIERPAEGERPLQTDRVEIVMNSLSPVSANATHEADLTRHKWAGLDLNVRLVAIDGAGQEGVSETRAFRLPDKLLLQPLARAAQEVRLDLLREDGGYAQSGPDRGALTEGGLNLAATNRLEAAPPGVQIAALKLDALTYQPHSYFRDMTLFLGLRQARDLIGSAADMDEALRADPILWATAMRAEYGSVADALGALMAAKRALEKALRDGASEDEIARLVEAFKDAAKNYIAAKMAQAMTGEAAPDMEGMDTELGGEGSPNLGAGDLQDMLDALSDLSQTGATEQARQLLSDITTLLENLEFQKGKGSSADGFPMPGQEGEAGEEADNAPEDEKAMRDILERLSKLLGDQRELNDDTLRAGQRDPFANPAPGSGQSPGELADRQGELGDQLSGIEQQMQELAESLGEDGAGGQSGGEDGAGPSLDEEMLQAVRRAQRRAESALERGDLRGAERFQEEATEALRGLTADAAGELDRLRGEGKAEVDEYDGEETDPFGNPIGGADDTNTVQIPREADRQRAKDILEELRRRFSETGDEKEKDYLGRLLDRF